MFLELSIHHVYFLLLFCKSVFLTSYIYFMPFSMFSPVYYDSRQKVLKRNHTPHPLRPPPLPPGSFYHRTSTNFGEPRNQCKHCPLTAIISTHHQSDIILNIILHIYMNKCRQTRDMKFESRDKLSYEK